MLAAPRMASEERVGGGEDRLMGQSLESLSPEQRIDHYRDMAMQATRSAGEAHFTEIRAQFLRLAGSWLALADVVESRNGEYTLRINDHTPLGAKVESAVEYGDSGNVADDAQRSWG